MFTGLVEKIGRVSDLIVHGSLQTGADLIIEDVGILRNDANLGDSIAVNGTCLTITELYDDGFKFGLAPETIRLTNLSLLKKNQKVNLERAISTQRFGGHFVQGHVDGTAKVVSVIPDGDAVKYTYEFTEPFHNLIDYVVHKGFIAIDGASVTVIHVDDDKHQFSVMLVPYTQERIINSTKKVNDLANIEVDLIAKMNEKQINNSIKKMFTSFEPGQTNKDTPLNDFFQKSFDNAISNLSNKQITALKQQLKD